MRRGTLIAAAIVLVALGVAAAALLTHASARKVMPPQAAALPAVPVVAAPAASGDVPIYFRGIGYVEAYNTVVVHSRVEGQIMRIAFTEGQAVHPGDLLAQIDPRPYQAQLDEAIANRDRDQAQLTNAQLNLQRYLPLLAKGFATPQLVDTQKAQVAQYAAAVKSDAAAIENAQVQLGYTRITAAIDGVTGVRGIDVGNIIHPTDTNGLVVITQLQPISVIFTLPEADLPQIQQQMAKGKLTVLAYSQDGKTVLDQGTLEVLDNEVIKTSGSVRLKADFPNAANRLWPGELITTRLLVETRRDALTIAASAVQQGPQGPYVYVVGADGTVESRAVDVARIGGARAVVDSGLKAGEQVVVDGQSRLQPGSRVTILEGSAAAAQTLQQLDIP